MWRSFRRIVALMLVAVLLAAQPAQAAAAAAESPPPDDLPPGITLQQFQSLSCLGGGVTGALAALGYHELTLSAVAASAGLSFSILAPLLAAGFLAGCSVGSTMSPGLLWIFRQSE